MTDDDDDDVARHQPGIAVDARGGAVIDPTKNVLDLVRAESKYQDAMRSAVEIRLIESLNSLKEMLKLISDNSKEFQNAQRESETRRINELAQTRQEFSNTIRDMLAESVRTTSTLVSTQLVQIQATFDTRISKLEAADFTQAGRSSERDPAISDAIARMTSDISSLTQQQSDASLRLNQKLSVLETAESTVGGQRKGMQDTNARLLAVVMAVAAVASPVIAILVTIMAVRGK